MRKMLKREKMEQGVVELVDTESLVPQGHLLRDIYAAYKKSRHKKEFLAKHGAEIARHEEAKRAFDALGGKPIPKVNDGLGLFYIRRVPTLN